MDEEKEDKETEKAEDNISVDDKDVEAEENIDEKKSKDDPKTDEEIKSEKNESEEKQKDQSDSEEIVIEEKHKENKLMILMKQPKFRLYFFSGIGLLIIIFLVVGFLLLRREDKASTTTDNTEKITEQAEVTSGATIANVLTGVATDQASAIRHPLAITVENDPSARPQSGLDKADIVYETVYDPAETTRFLAIYSSKEAEKIGPIRSARTFFVDWAHGYNAYLGHWGGNIDALDKIKAEKILDLDEFAYSNAFWREESSGLALEHTGYTSTEKLRAQATKNNYPTTNSFAVYKFKDDAELTTRPEAEKITVDFSGANYKVVYNYDKTTNLYKRSIAGKPHLDKITKDQIAPKNLIVMVVARKPVTTRINEDGYAMTTVGSGAARFFIDGKETIGTWKKASAAEREIFYDAAGQEIVFDRGQSWISIVADGTKVTAE
ncbi:MAG: DUF3048 domain-containing protein [Candidatus Berkelbacteria bacterium]